MLLNKNGLKWDQGRNHLRQMRMKTEQPPKICGHSQSSFKRDRLFVAMIAYVKKISSNLTIHFWKLEKEQTEHKVEERK